MLVQAVVIPASGWAADRFGARRVFVAAMSVFLLGSVLCGLRGSLGQLVAFRIIQGIGRRHVRAGRADDRGRRHRAP